MPRPRSRPRTGLVLSGGGARGAYEAGILAELLPWLEAHDAMPDVVVGTSVGALNAVQLASTVHLGAAAMVEALLGRWAELTQDRVIRPLVGPSSVTAAATYVGDVVGLPGVRLRALLDPTPLWSTVEAWMDWDAVRANVGPDGPLRALGVATTRQANERATVFVEGVAADALPRARHVDYVGTELELEHVLASAAIPTLFPAVRVRRPEPVSGWYVDGGVRLNAPLRPALDLGARRLVIVANHPQQREHAVDPDATDRPDAMDGLTELVQAALVDPLIQDLETLGVVNELVARLPSDHDLPYREVPFLFAGPPSARRLRDVADAVLDRDFSGVRGALRSPSLRALTHLLGGASPARAELLSYLFFEPRFVRAAVAAGREDAGRLLADDPWRTVVGADPPGCG